MFESLELTPSNVLGTIFYVLILYFVIRISWPILGEYRFYRSNNWDFSKLSNNNVYFSHETYQYYKYVPGFKHYWLGHYKLTLNTTYFLSIFIVLSPYIKATLNLLWKYWIT